MPKSGVPIKINAHQRQKLKRKHPDDGSSSAVGRRAVALATLYLNSRYVGCERIASDKGADLAVVYRRRKLNFEVKGTRVAGVSWSKLKVSSVHSHRLLVGGMQLLRITLVFGRKPIIYVLEYPNDFELRKEPRWSLHPPRQ